MKSILTLLFVSIAISQSAFADYPNAYNLIGIPDTDHQVSQYINAEVGGVLTTLDADGNYYELTIPKKALARNLVITLIPIKASGLIGEKNHLGVDILPAGTKLFPFAKLIIRPKGLDNKNFYWFETTGDVKNITAIPAFTYDGMEGVLLTHFSGGTMAMGDAQTTASLNGGSSDYSIDWFKWQRTVVEQDYKSGKIDWVTRDTNLGIIDQRLAELAQQEIDKLVIEAEKKLQEAMDRAEHSANDPDLNSTRIFIKNVGDAFANGRKIALVGKDKLDMKKISEYFDKYASAIFKNCAKEAYDVNTIRELERLRQFVGGEEHKYDMSACFKDARTFLLTGEYISRRLTEEKPPRGFNNVIDRFEVLMQITVVPNGNGAIKTFILGTADMQAKYDLEYIPTYIEGEDCTVEQSPFGIYDAFTFFNRGINLSGYYIPGMDIPDNVPLPPNFPRHRDPKAQLDIELNGQSKMLGWKFKASDPSCKERDIAPTVGKVNFTFRVDPFADFKEIGFKKIQNKVTKTELKEEGWTFTIERTE